MHAVNLTYIHKITITTVVPAIVTYLTILLHMYRVCFSVFHEKLISLKPDFPESLRFVAICRKSGSRRANLISLLATEPVPAVLG